jgi:uncharacterized protein (DUF1778 family)
MDSVAAALGRNCSDFMLDVECGEAESVLLDRCYFNLGDEAFQRFSELLHHPPADNPMLARLLQWKPSREQGAAMAAELPKRILGLLRL